MKKLMTISLFILAITTSWGQISMERAYEELLEKKVIPQDENQWVYGFQEILPPGTKIKSFDKTFTTPKMHSWMFFIDENPYANWQHDAKYVFYNVGTGAYEIIKATTPPDNIHEMKVLYKYLETQERFLDFTKDINNITCGTASNKYAVIISGGWNQGNNHVRYWNDCSFVYKTLVNKYGYLDANIYTLISDGTNAAADISNGTNSNPDLDGDGDSDIQFSATTANISTVFDTLSGILDEDDELFIFTTDHGGVDNSGATTWDTLLYLWGETITDDAFAVEVNKVSAGKISIVMEQCNSGGFIDDLSGPNRVIATAARHDELSWAGPTINTDEFVYYWTSAVNEALPNGTAVVSDANSDGVITQREAFDYAEAEDTRPETPQFDEVPINLGDQLTLNGTGDLYIMDNRTPYHSADDVGEEPNTFSGPMYTSQDIWIRQSLDNGVTHENPEYKTTSPNGVYVRVKNRGCAPISDGKLHVYFSKASTGLSWPTNWINYYDFTPSGNYLLHGDEITSTPIAIPNLEPGAETIIEIPWYPPNPNDFDTDKHHFCLVARIISQIDPIGVETTSVNNNTRNNNNIAWKNISVYDVNPSNNIRFTSVYVRNTFEKAEDLINVTFLDGIYGTKEVKHFLKYGKITATLDPELFERWIENGKGRGIEVIDEYTIQIVDTEATLMNIPLKPNETFGIHMQFELNENVAFNDAFTFDVVQSNKEGVIGGERFDLVYQKEISDKEDQMVAALFSVYPNPTKDMIVLDYTVDSIKVPVFVVLKNIQGATVLKSEFSPENIGRNMKELKMSTIDKGIYILSFTIDGTTYVKQVIKE